jgi:LCP family protein required for cell wall assembly
MKSSVKTKKTVNSPKKQKKNVLITQRIEPPSGADKFLHFFIGIFLRILTYVVVFFFGAAVALTLALVTIAVFYLRIVSTHSGIPSQKLVELAMDGRHASVAQTDGRTNFLILGTDSLENRDTQSKLTDTIMIISVQPQTGRLATFSLPRDLWIASQSAKINALTEKGEREKGEGRGHELTQTVVSDITGINIHKVTVIDIVTVGKLIDAFGGLAVDVERSFVDYKFPRSDIDVRVVRDPAKLYETIAFTKGIEHMSGDRALRYIRSRHSLDPIEGSDDARVMRQQRVIAALMGKLKDPMILRNPEQIGRILQIYQADIESGLPLEDAVALGWSFVENQQVPALESRQFTEAFSHPDRFPGGAWVYLPVDPTYTQMRDQVAEWIHN